MARNTHPAAVILAACLGLAAQAAATKEKWVFNAPAADGYSIHLTEVTPAPGTALTAGQTIEFKVTVTYSMTIAPKGRIVLVFQDDAGELAESDREQVVVPVSGPIGNLTLTDKVLIPSHSKELLLFVPLVPDGLKTTTGEVTIRYPIGPHIAANAPVDIVYEAGSPTAMQAEFAPYVAKARATWPEAKARYLAGLPPKHAFFVTYQLQDQKGNVERVFVAVHEIAEGVVHGRIWNEITLVEGFEFRQEISFPEADVLDWTIARPDGTEEGNFIGKYVDEKRSKP